MAIHMYTVNMASLLPETLFEINGQSPPPYKDWYHFAITKTRVTWCWWNISRNYAKPGQLTESHQDFLEDRHLHGKVIVVFGQKVLEYTKALCQGHYDYLERLPDPLLLRILAHLELEDVGELSKTSRRFRKQLCASDAFWEQAVRRLCEHVPDGVAALAAELGWRRIFFASRLQLQVQIRRRKNRPKHTQGDAGTRMEGL